MPISGLAGCLKMLLTAAGIQVEPEVARNYVCLIMLFGLYRAYRERKVFLPFARLWFARMLFCVVWLASCFTTPSRWLVEYLSSFRPRREVEHVEGGPPQVFGHFRWNKKDYYRHSDSSLSQVQLTGGSTTTSPEGLETSVLNWSFVQDVELRELSPGESALGGQPSNAVPASLEKGHVLIYDSQLQHFSSGVVIENVLVMCRHNTSGLTHIVVRGTNSTTIAGKQSGVRIEMSRAHYLDSHGAPAWQESRHTCTFLDILAIPLEKDEISAIGVKSFKDKDMTRLYEGKRGSLTFAADEFSRIIREEGYIPEAEPKVHNLGLALAQIVSKPGASSSGVCVVQEGTKFAGMWLGRPAHSLKKYQGQRNLFMHTDAVLVNLEKMGLVRSPLLEKIRRWTDALSSDLPTGESRESKKERAARQWFEYLASLDEETKECYEEGGDWIQEQLHGSNGCGYARQPRTQPLLSLPSAIAAPLSRGPMSGESLGATALSVAVEHNNIDLDARVKSWKHGFMKGEGTRVLREISFYIDEASFDVKERLKAVLDVPSNGRLRDYMQATMPDWNTKTDEEIPDRDGNPYFRHVGSYEHVRAPKLKNKKDGESPLQRRLRELANRYHANGDHGCTKGEYKIPASSKKNIDRSLKAQARLATAARPKLVGEQIEDFEDAVRRVCEKYSRGIGATPVKTYLEEGESGFLKTFLGYEDKSSGVSSRYRALKKSAWVKAHPEEVIDLSLSRLILIAVAGDQLSDLDPIELVRYGLSDVKDIFMKAEGHSPQKMNDGRYRLIWISSLIDLTVQSLLHKADNAAHIDAYQNGTLTCAALGMGHSDEGLQQLVNAFRAEGVADVNVSSDASAFDFSVDGSFIHADGKRRAGNCADSYVGRLVKRYAHILCSHVINNNGDVWLCLKYGVTSSGQLSTSAQNTFARSVMAAFGGCEGWTCAGDDLVGDEGFDPQRLLFLGVRSRDVEKSWGYADFTSHYINTETGTAVFCNVEKLLWHLVDASRDVSTNRERFGAVQHILRSTPGVLEDITAIINEFGINTEGYVNDTGLANDFA